MKQVLLLLFIFMFIGATNVGSNSFQKVSWKDLRPELPAPIISTNEITLIDVEDKINLAGEILVVGARANEKRTLLKNFWYGYIDEIRLWNTILTDSTIKFQSGHPDKLGDNYRHTDGNGNEISTYLDSLIGIWRLNFEEPLTIIEDASEHDNDGNIYSLSGFSVELSEKGAQ